METRIQFISGLDTIGGNIIAIEHGNHRIVTDFGVINGASDYDLFNYQRTETLIEKDQLPELDGIYDGDRLPDGVVKSVSESEMETIVLISHLHIDHVGSLFHLSDQVPVYTTMTSAYFYSQLVETNQLPDYQVDFQGVVPGKTIDHGPFKVTFHESDHDTPGVASIFIEAPDLKLIHSGDVRLTGFHPEKVLAWAQEAREWEPDVLLLEGTSFSHLGDEPNTVDLALDELTTNMNADTEMNLLNNVDLLLTENPDHLFAFNGYPQNIERMGWLAQLLSIYGREFVLQPEVYQLYVNMLPGAAKVSKLGSDVTLDMIKANPDRYCLQVADTNYEQLFDLPAGIFLHSNGVPIGSYDPAYEPFIRSIVDRDWNFVHANVSGHASSNDLLTLAYTIGAKLTVPWHTFKPDTFGEAMRQRGLATWVPKYEAHYTAKDIQKSIQSGGGQPHD